MQRGEVWQVVLPVAPQGREQSGMRPVVVIQEGVYGARSPLVLIVPLTSQLSALRFPATVSLLKELQNLTGIPSDDTGNRLESNVADDDSPP